MRSDLKRGMGDSVLVIGYLICSAALIAACNDTANPPAPSSSANASSPTVTTPGDTSVQVETSSSSESESHASSETIPSSSQPNQNNPSTSPGLPDNFGLGFSERFKYQENDSGRKQVKFSWNARKQEGVFETNLVAEGNFQKRGEFDLSKSHPNWSQFIPNDFESLHSFGANMGLWQGCEGKLEGKLRIDENLATIDSLRISLKGEPCESTIKALPYGRISLPVLSVTSPDGHELFFYLFIEGSALADCGTEGGVQKRVADCALQNKGLATLSIPEKGKWILVSRAGNKAYWLGTATKKIWGPVSEKAMTLEEGHSYCNSDPLVSHIPEVGEFLTASEQGREEVYSEFTHKHATLWTSSKTILESSEPRFEIWPVSTGSIARGSKAIDRNYVQCVADAK
jgi:hypothetical protein